MHHAIQQGQSDHPDSLPFEGWGPCTNELTNLQVFAFIVYCLIRCLLLDTMLRITESTAKYVTFEHSPVMQVTPHLPFPLQQRSQPESTGQSS